MPYAIFPLTEDSWQVFTLDLTIDGEAFHEQIEIRYLPASGLASSEAGLFFVFGEYQIWMKTVFRIT